MQKNGGAARQRFCAVDEKLKDLHLTWAKVKRHLVMYFNHNIKSLYFCTARLSADTPLPFV